MKVDRSIQPVRSGTVERAGVELAWEEYGTGERTLQLLPPWNLQDSRVWKLVIGCLHRQFRILVHDPPGNGRSGAAADPARHSPEELALDAVAVARAAGVDKAVVVAHSRACQALLVLAADHPDLVAGAVFLAPLVPVTRSLFPRFLTHPALAPLLNVPNPVPVGWGRLNTRAIRHDPGRFRAWFIRRALSTTHVEQVIDEAVERARTGDVPSLLASLRTPVLRDRGTLRRLAGRVDVPVLVVHGDRDRLLPLADGRWLARETGGTLVVLPGGDHCPHGRPVVRTSLEIRTFADRVLGPHPSSPPERRGGPRRGRPRVLVVSSPIGLGHARRDLAVVQALRSLREDVEVEWLAQDPVTRVLEAAGEAIHPASASLLSECRHFELESVGHELDVFGAFRRADDLMAHNFMVFRDVLAREDFACVIADEAWEIDHYLHEHPQEKRAPFVWMTDFVGVLPAPGTDDRTAELIADSNALMVEQTRRGGVRDLSLFVGNPEDALDVPLGPGLPTVRQWALEQFTFTGYAGARQYDERARAEARRALGVAADEPLCVVAVGGSGVGDELLRRAARAHHVARRTVEDLRTVVVTGPRIRMDGIAGPGLDLRGYLPDLDKVLAAADMAVVQGGLATAMELTANRTPFAYVPLEKHFEQQLHVPHRLANYAAGVRVPFSDADPDQLADVITRHLGTRMASRPVEVGAERRAAEAIAALIA